MNPIELTEEERRIILTARNAAERFADSAWLRLKRARGSRAKGRARKAWEAAERDARDARAMSAELLANSYAANW